MSGFWGGVWLSFFIFLVFFHDSVMAIVFIRFELALGAHFHNSVISIAVPPAAGGFFSLTTPSPTSFFAVSDLLSLLAQRK
ncbi:hypothetical protein HPC37_10150 [Pasteurellaceae bacterium 20609_3]|uniref:hypothetical protein n=1 Tax=Spirabiliibacterium mucosae TaxID=28156 RepID=UPI001AADEDB8|nr:hypothetical protein [Spirabiliibacterium mucosae]MBE2899123.1 hypothetical protein [Spirabiliibacterium mucosae]